MELLAGLAIAGLLLGCLGKAWWVFDLFSHFRLQYIALLVLCLVAFVFLRRWKAAIVILLVATLAAFPLWPFFRKPAAASVAPDRLKIVTFNLHTSNTRHSEVLDYLNREDADIVFLIEVDNEWLKGLQALDRKYPFHLKSPRSDNFGIATFSKRPLEKLDPRPHGPYELPMLDATVTVGGSSCRILGLHTLPPTSAENARLRNEQLMDIADRASASTSDATIIMGDFNITPFSPWFGEILRRSGLRNSEVGFGCAPTWRRKLPLIAIPIDHALVSPSVSILERKIGPSCGSDHNPLAITLGITPPGEIVSTPP